MKFHCAALLTALVTSAAAAKPGSLVRRAPTTSNKNEMQRALEELIVPYNEIESNLEPWEEIAREIFTNTNDERSQTIPGRETSFRILRPQRPGAHVKTLRFVLEEEDLFVHRVDAEFTDGSMATGGISTSSTNNPGLETVSLAGGPLTGTITVEARLGINALVNRVTFDDKDRTIARGDTNAGRVGPTRVYDVDGRYITGIIVSADNRMRNLQFIVSREIASSQLVDIDYALPSLGNQQAKSLDTITLSNESSETQTFSVSYTAIESSAISLSSERTQAFSVGFGISTTFDVNIPFVGGSETTAEFTTSAESTFTSGQTEETALTKEVSRQVEVAVPPETVVELTVTQFQERIADISYTATHIITFVDGSKAVTAGVEGTLEGVAVSSVFMTTQETSLNV